MRYSNDPSIIILTNGFIHRNYGYTKSNSKQPNARFSVPKRSSTASPPKNSMQKKKLPERVPKHVSSKKRNS